MSNELIQHFDWVSANDAAARRAQAGFHAEVVGLLRQLILPGRRVYEGGCGRGELLRALRPARGLGVDFSPAMIREAREADPSGACEYQEGDVTTLVSSEHFDYLVLDFIVGYLPDVQDCFQHLRCLAEPRTRLCVLSINNVWTPVLTIGRWLGMVTNHPAENWLASRDLLNLLELSGWEVVQRSTEILLPFRVPVLSALFNHVLVRLPGIRHLGSCVYLVARPRWCVPLVRSCSVIIPIRNEEGNIRAALERLPILGDWTEIIFVEGGSRDDSWATIEREVANYSGPLKLRAIQQSGRGKWDAVRAGFDIAQGDVVVVQDGDLTAPPEDLPKFFHSIETGAAEFANGSRLVYPMEKDAMRFLNLVANKVFALLLSYVIGQPIKDSLCGTKMLLRSDYEQMKPRIAELGNRDPFGDFNLLFGAAMLKLRIRDIPVRYKERTYGRTNISRFREGWLLFKMVCFGLNKVKFGSGSTTRSRD